MEILYHKFAFSDGCGSHAGACASLRDRPLRPALRIYNRILSEAEIKANYAIDKARLGIV